MAAAQTQEQIIKNPADQNPHNTKLKIAVAAAGSKRRRDSMPDEIVIRADGSLGPADPAPVEPCQPPVSTSKTSKPVSMEITNPGPSDVSAAGGAAGPTSNPAAPTAPSLPVAMTQSLSMQPGQRGQTEKMQKTGSAVLAEKLGPQLATAPEYLAHMQIDERKLAVLNDLTSTSLVYLRFRAWIDHVRFWQWFVDGELVSSQAINGRARRDILKALEAGQGHQIQEVRRPSVFARNIWARDWRHKAEMQGENPQDYDEQ